MMKLFEPQPASKMYAFDGGWYVMRYMFKNVFINTGVEAKPWSDRAAQFLDEAVHHQWGWLGGLLKVWKTGLALGFWLGSAAHYAAALLITGLFTVMQLIILIVSSLLATVAMVILTLFNVIYTSIYRIRIRCPHCHEQVAIPIHVCPTCSTHHTRLWPSTYGIFKHRCNSKRLDGVTICGESLPTLALLGRNELTRLCPNCKQEMFGIGTNVHIPIIGGPTSGKSHYIAAATQALLEQYMPSIGYTANFPDPNHERDYKASIERLNKGQQLIKTSDADDAAHAYQIEIRSPKQRVPKLMYIYDLAGEFVTSTDRAFKQTYFKYIHGIILVIDPFSIDTLRAEYEVQIREDGKTLAASTDDPEAIYERMVEALEGMSTTQKNFQFKRGTRFPHPLAVVISKVDAFDLEVRIGQPAARALMLKRSDIHHEEDALNVCIAEFLEVYGMGNFMRMLHAQFEDVKFFSCSSLGRMPDTSDKTRFEERRVLEPVMHFGFPGSERLMTD